MGYELAEQFTGTTEVIIYPTGGGRTHRNVESVLTRWKRMG